MTENERELINIIHQYSNTDKAIEIAIKTIVEFLEQDESYQEHTVAYLRELA